MRRRRVLRFVEDDDGIVECAAAHKGKRGDLYDVRVEVFLEFAGRYHLFECVVERLQVRVDLLFHVAGQETELFARFDGGAAKDDFFYLFVLQRADSKGYACECLSRTGRPDSEEHVACFVGFDHAALVFAARRDRPASRAVHDDVCGGFFAGALSACDVEDVFFCERVVLGAVMLKGCKLFGECGDVIFVADNADHVVARCDAQFGTQGAQHAQIRVSGTEEELRVGFF